MFSFLYNVDLFYNFIFICSKLVLVIRKYAYCRISIMNNDGGKLQSDLILKS